MSASQVLSLFHPVVQEWFLSRFAGPTEPQVEGWPSIAAGEHTLISAPTGSGKTLTAFLAVIDRLFRQGAAGELPEGVQTVYVSPLRALSNDMQRNLSGPLAEILETAEGWGIQAPAIRVGLRTGDTSSYERAKLVKNPPQILVTTPESLYLMLTSERSREVLRSVQTVIVDEIHALVRDKRGSHLALSLERLEALADAPLQRIGLSATQKPIERMAEFLIGGVRPGDARNDSTPERRCTIVNVGHTRPLDLGIEIPPSPLEAVCSHEQWAEINARIVELINSHRSTLIFVNTRRLAERLTHQLTQILGENAVGSHHGSLSKELRLRTEQQLKDGELKAVVATSSLELGIDVGYIDLVMQIGSPRAIAAFLQRIGRSGHALGLTPKGRLFALTRDELTECMALLRAVRQGRLDVTPIPEAPIDILAQQIVAETATQEWGAEDLFDRLTRAWPYRNLSRETFEQVLHMLSVGLTNTAGRGQAFIHYDRVNGRLRGRRAARLVALSNGGAIAEVDTVRVVLEDENTVVGTVDEEFAVESSSGDIFLLGNSSWRIRRLRGNDLIVADAQGAPPTIPFWRGEAPGRTIELSEEVSRLREDVERWLIEADAKAVGLPADPANDDTGELDDRPAKWAPLADRLQAETACTADAAWQTLHYMAAQRAAIGLLPTQQRVVFERFFDESGGMQLVVHAPFGGRINRGWGLAFRKRFCRSFDFELQATADDDGFILSLGPQHSFPIESLFPMMRTDNARNLLEQALLAVPMFHLRWRWNVTRSLFVSRMKNGKKVPPALQRFRSEDMLTAVFPKLTGCQENITGDHEIPDHPLVQQTVADCLFEALDLEGLEEVLGRIESGDVTLVGRDTREPSPFAYELLNANPYAFLDGGEVQERRARAVATRRSLNVESMRDLGRLNPQAIDEVVAEAQPDARNADELHDLLLSRVLAPIQQAGTVQPQSALTVSPVQWHAELTELQEDGRVVRLAFAPDRSAWVATESLLQARALYPDATVDREPVVPSNVRQDWTDTEALLSLLRGWMEIAGPATAAQIADLLALPAPRVFACLEALEGEGLVLRGRFRFADPATDSNSPEIEWCHRRLLARIHRRTISGLRQEIEAVSPAVFWEFLTRHHGAAPGHRKQGTDGVYDVVSRLQGMDAPAGAWEQDILPLRIEGYRSRWLDELCLSGDVGWGRLETSGKRKSAGRPMASMTRSIPVSLFLREDHAWLAKRSPERSLDDLSSSAQEVLELFAHGGALFTSDLLQQTRTLPAQLDDTLGELAASGWLTSDGFSGLRRLIRASADDSESAGSANRYRRVRKAATGLGRWTPLRAPECPLSDDEIAEEWAWQLLRRWGVVFRDLAIRESLAPPWWQLLRIYRRLEARGELRGGRFIKGVSGEQFAASEAIRELREIRQADRPGDLLVISAADPLNLTGVLVGGARIPALTNHQIALLRGQVVGWKKAEETWVSPELDADNAASLAERWGMRPKPVRALPGNEARQLSPVVVADDQSRPSGDSAPPADRPSTRTRRSPSRSGIPRPFPF